MSSIRLELTGDTDRLISRLQGLSAMDRQGVLESIAEGLRTSTIERFEEQKDPEGDRWIPSIRASENGGKTLTETAGLRNSIHTEVSSNGLAVGTNDIRAATLQYGAERTIRARNADYLAFKQGGQWRRVKSVRVRIPSRPFLGISRQDEQDIREQLEELFKE